MGHSSDDGWAVLCPLLVRRSLEDGRSAAAHAVASVYSFPARDNPEGFVLELLRKGLSTEEALAVMFTLDCAWAGESGFVSTPWNPAVLSLPSDQLMSEAGEMADTISLSRLWQAEPIPYEARLELREQGFLRPEAVGSPPAPIEPEADLGPLASGTGDPSIVDPGALYDCGKVSPFNSYFEGLSETIDPKTGGLIVRQKDLTLPGRNGFDLVIERVCNSQQAAARKPVVDVRAKWRVRKGPEQHWSELSGAFVERGQTYRHRFAGSISWEEQWVINGTIRARFSGAVYKMLWKPDSWSWTCVSQESLNDWIQIPAPEGSMKADKASATAKLDVRATYLDHKYGIGLGWSFAFPSVEVSKDGTLLHLGDGSVYRVDFSCGTPSNLFDYWSRDLVFAREKARFSGAESESAYCLAAKDGTKTYFAPDGRLLIRGRRRLKANIM